MVPAAMPYNTTAITPKSEVTGTVALPLARVKKIIAADADNAHCSNNASFAITVAAEMFLQHLVEQSHNVAKSERKPRRNIQYRDVAHAVARVENLDFLADVVPKTTTYKQYKQKPAGPKPGAPQPALIAADGRPNGQRTLDRHMAPVAGAMATNGGARVSNTHVEVEMEQDGDESGPSSLGGVRAAKSSHGGARVHGHDGRDEDDKDEDEHMDDGS